MIDVRRFDSKERTDVRGNVIPAFYTCEYRHNGIEIANYNSKSDIVYLNSDLLLPYKRGTVYERAIGGKYKEAFEYLFNMLNIDSTTKMSEFTNIGLGW